MSRDVVLVCPSARAVRTAQTLDLPGAILSVRESPSCANTNTDHPRMPSVFTSTREELQARFLAGHPIVALCAVGIVVRALAPALGQKMAEPPVVVVAADGSAVVPLLGGHRGSNALAARIAGQLGVKAAVTTASETALDALPPGYSWAQGTDVYAPMQALAGGAELEVRGEAPFAESFRAAFRASTASALSARKGKVAVWVSPHAEGQKESLLLHPQVLVLGFGCARDQSPEPVVQAAQQILGAYAPQALAGIASLDIKMDEAVGWALERHFGRPLRCFSAAELEALTPRLSTPSEVVHAAVGCHGVAEAAALALAGPESQLVVPKLKGEGGEGWTLALALSPAVVEVAQRGCGRGRLDLVSLGPGDARLRTPAMLEALTGADCVIGYSLYLEQIENVLSPDQERISMPLGQERERALLALEVASRGQRVALVSSGDIGIFGMASLVYETLEASEDHKIKGVDVRGIPGVSAFQAAGAALGAPFGHDFSCISLSDLLTPAVQIRERVEAAARSDCVVAFYNPRSRTRTCLLAEAFEILRAHRPAFTPVAFARSVGRAGERIHTTTLEAAQSTDADMHTLVVVGSSQTRRSGGFVFTPRGYDVSGGEGRST